VKPAKPRTCRHCGDEITRSAPLSPRTCIGCYRARHPKEKVERPLRLPPTETHNVLNKRARGMAKALVNDPGKRREFLREITRTVPAYTMTRASTTEGSAKPLKAKQPPHRSESLRQSAKGEPCIACGREDGTTVWAHSNELAHGKAKSRKSHDLLGLYLCSVCHHLFDGSPSWTREQKQAFFKEHYDATMVRVSEKLAAGELKL
jgi:hypothetical protein